MKTHASTTLPGSGRRHHHNPSQAGAETIERLSNCRQPPLASYLEQTYHNLCLACKSRPGDDKAKYRQQLMQRDVLCPTTESNLLLLAPLGQPCPAPKSAGNVRICSDYRISNLTPQPLAQAHAHLPRIGGNEWIIAFSRPTQRQPCPIAAIVRTCPDYRIASTYPQPPQIGGNERK